MVVVEPDEETAYPETSEVYLLNNLNDTRGFCIDMTGYKTNADVNKALQTHSCYSYQGSVSVDQGFDVSKTSEGSGTDGRGVRMAGPFLGCAGAAFSER